ncbi:MAG: RNA methyltransferase [Clostridia bacterium]|nr:RNA methyltransferase [Clostridia bacterium]
MIKEAERQKDSTLFEGMTSINAILRSIDEGSTRRITKIWFDKAKRNSKGREYAFLKGVSERYGFELLDAEAEFIDDMAVGNTHGGVIALCTKREIPRLSNDTILKDKGFYVMIEGIEDPYNFGYALRTLYAAGVDGVILPERNWMSAAGVVCRASAGASELMSTYVADPLFACESFRKRSYKVVCAGIRDSVSVFDADLTYPVFLIVGGEKRGISAAVMQKADLTVRIDYGREFKGSLSAASAASVLAYEVFRQNR